MAKVLIPTPLRQFAEKQNAVELQGATVGDWPLNVFDDEQAAAELPTMRAMASADLHNLVFQLGGDYRIIPAILNGQTP